LYVEKKGKSALTLHFLSFVFDPITVSSKMMAHKVDVRVGTKVIGMETKDHLVTAVNVEGGVPIATDGVVLSIGVRPQTALAIDCGLKIGESGGIWTNEYMQTSDENIYACGDVAETLGVLSGARSVHSLAGPANKEGRVAGANAAGANPRFKYNG
jgi:CoA-dependent NAD(P)H sulfur oxidoreductase